MAKTQAATRRSRGTFIQNSRRRSPEEKAVFHNVAGAGRSRVKRPFLGLTPSEEKELAAQIAPLIDGVVQRRS